MTGELAPALWGIPVVSGSSERAALFPTPATNQRVFNLTTGYVERWNGITWYIDFSAGGVRFADAFPGADFGAKVAAALADLPAGGGTIDARNLSGAQTMAANLVINKSNVQLLLGNMTMTSAFQILVPSPISNIKVIGPVPIGGNPDNSATGAQIVYTGNVSAIQMGDTLGTSYNHQIENVSVNIAGAGNAAIGIDSIRVYHTVFPYVRVIGKIGVTTQIGIRNNGTNIVPGSQNMLIISPYISNCFIGIQAIGMNTPPSANMNQIMGGEITGSGSGTAGSIGIDIENGNNNNFYGPTIANYETAIRVASTSGRAVYGDFHAESCVNAVVFTAAANNNWLYTDSGNLIVDGNGTNTVINSFNVIFSADGTNNRWKNARDLDVNLILQPGLTVERQGFLIFRNFAGSNLWNLGKLTDNSFGLQDSAGNNLINVPTSTGGSFRLNAPFGAGALDLGRTANSGTAGVRLWSGGASPAQIASFSGGATPVAQFQQPLNKDGQASIVADTAAINTTETVVVKSAALAASRLKAGTVIRAVLEGVCTASVGNTSTFQIRIGVNGTTADTLVFSAVTAASAATGTAVPFRAILELTVRTVGATATAVGFLTLETTGGTGTGIATVPVQVILATMTTFDSTLANIISATYQSAAVTTTSTFKNAFLEVVYQ